MEYKIYAVTPDGKLWIYDGITWTEYSLTDKEEQVIEE